MSPEKRQLAEADVSPASSPLIGLLRQVLRNKAAIVVLTILGIAIFCLVEWRMKAIFGVYRGELARSLDDVKAMESRINQALTQFRETVKTTNDEIVANMPKKLPPVVLAVFPPGETSRPILEGLGLFAAGAPPAATPVPQIPLTGNCTLEYLRESNSPGDTARQIRDRMSKENVVLIIGHQSSQAVKELNQELYESKGFVDLNLAMPVILPAATNPALTQSPSKGIHHILRLPATDELQIGRLKSLLTGLKSQKVALIVDSSNAAYSTYIAQELILGVKDATIVDCVGVALGGDGFSPTRFLDSEPDTVVFVGMEIQADLLLRRLADDKRFAPQQKLNLVFTDGVAGEGFQSLSRELMRAKLEEKVSIYVTGPFPTTTSRGTAVGQLPNFKNYGITAKQLAKELIEDAQRSGEVTIQSVLKELQLRLTNNRESMIAEMRVKFDEKGDVVSGQEHVYEQGAQDAWHSRLCACGEPALSNKAVTGR